MYTVNACQLDQGLRPSYLRTEALEHQNLKWLYYVQIRITDYRSSNRNSTKIAFFCSNDVFDQFFAYNF